jgi:hypothetical protein
VGFVALYRKSAADCAKRAEQSRDAIVKAAYRELAHAWLLLAEGAQQLARRDPIALAGDEGKAEENWRPVEFPGVNRTYPLGARFRNTVVTNRRYLTAGRERGVMSLLEQGCFGPEALSVASEALSRAWTFIERDPMLASYESEKLQAELARGILEVVQTGERDLLQITNRAIRRVRERMLAPEKQSRVTSPSADRAKLALVQFKGVSARGSDPSGPKLLADRTAR